MLINCSNSTLNLANKIAYNCNLDIAHLNFTKFSNQELWLNIEQKIEAEKIYLLQDLMHNPHERLFELMLAADSIKNLNAATKITAIIPYLCYSRQDRRFQAGASLASNLVLKLLGASLIDTIISIDLHNPDVMNFFNGNFINLSPANIFSEHIKHNIELTNAVIIAPDNGARLRAQNVANVVGLNIMVANKNRGLAITFDFDYDIKNKNCIIIDDLIDGGGTIFALSELLSSKGASNICAYASHGLFSGNFFENIQKSQVKSIAILDITEQDYNCSKILKLDCDKIFDNISIY